MQNIIIFSGASVQKYEMIFKNPSQTMQMRAATYNMIDGVFLLWSCTS